MGAGTETARIPGAGDSDRWYATWVDTDNADSAGGWTRIVAGGGVRALDETDRANIAIFLDEDLEDEWHIAPGACQASGEHPDLWRPLARIASSRLPGCLFLFVGDVLFPTRRAAVEHARLSDDP